MSDFIKLYSHDFLIIYNKNSPNSIETAHKLLVILEQRGLKGFLWHRDSDSNSSPEQNFEALDRGRYILTIFNKGFKTDKSAVYTLECVFRRLINSGELTRFIPVVIGVERRGVYSVGKAQNHSPRRFTVLTKYKPLFNNMASRQHNRRTLTKGNYTRLKNILEKIGWKDHKHRNWLKIGLITVAAVVVVVLIAVAVVVVYNQNDIVTFGEVSVNPEANTTKSLNTNATKNNITAIDVTDESKTMVKNDDVFTINATRTTPFMCKLFPYVLPKLCSHENHSKEDN
ncbi:unnamed protein product [Owenia fusiformis]|uniref:TIR domain-containing protein n=1 Tax=Owenia fusiformis TaxID=6347 RepID=A0A8S4QA50_OWEFU|nr:unnamed protein product [Owenia fusiformis]